MTDVPIGPTKEDTAQNLRTVINADTPTFGVTATGSAEVVVITAAAAGPSGTSIGLSASAANPVPSSAFLVAVSKIKTLIGGLVSEFRGVATMFFDGQICSNNPYPKKWEVRVRRVEAGWSAPGCWYQERAAIQLSGSTIKAMNPAHIIYECLTNPTWGRGYDPSRFDETSFVSAANVLYDEGFGLCIKWSRQTDLGPFIQSVVDHINAALYQDRSTGLWTLHLIRADYVAAGLPVFTFETGLLDIREDDSTAIDNSFSEIIVKWHDPIKNEERETRAQNLASRQANLSFASTTVEYKGIPTAELAARIAQRHITSQAGGIKRFNLTLDRRGRKIAPGGVFRINVPSRGIADMILRVGKIEEGAITENSIKLVAVQDVFGLDSTTYIGVEDNTWTPPDTSVVAVGTRRWRELSYRDLVRLVAPADLALIATDSGFIVIAAKQPTELSTDYILATAAFGEEYLMHGASGWTPTGTLATDVGCYTTVMALAPGHVGLDRTAGVAPIAWIENECVELVAMDPVVGLMTVRRGCIDTIPVVHAAGVRVWFPDSAFGVDGREYTTGEEIRIKLLTRTNGSQLALDDAPEDTIIISGRQGRPYPPGDLRVNGERYGDALPVYGEMVLSWTHRDRVIQADHILAHEDASTGPEPGTTYNIRLYDGVSLVRTVTGLIGTGWTYTLAMADTDGWVDDLTVELEFERDGLTSSQKYRWSVTHIDVGFDRGFDLHFDEGFT